MGKIWRANLGRPHPVDFASRKDCCGPGGDAIAAPARSLPRRIRIRGLGPFWPNAFAVVTLLNVRDGVDHLFKRLDRLEFVSWKTLAIGQMPQHDNHSVTDFPELPSVATDPAQYLRLGLR